MEKYDPETQSIIPKRYLSGGVDAAKIADITQGIAGTLTNALAANLPKETDLAIKVNLQTEGLSSNNLNEQIRDGLYSRRGFFKISTLLATATVLNTNPFISGTLAATNTPNKTKSPQTKGPN